jgi:biopolymer transport protein ExbB
MRRTNSAAGAGKMKGTWLRMAVAAALLATLGHFFSQPASVARLLAQEERNPIPGEELEDVAPAIGPATPGGTAAPQPRERTILDLIRDGGIIGAIIILISIVAVGFIVEHALTIRKERLMPEAVLDQLQELIAQGDLNGAAHVCEDPRNYSLATDVILAGIERFQNSEFGYAEYKSAVEEAGEEYTARLYRKTDVLSVIGAIAPMLGLLGTVVGMIGAFSTLGASEEPVNPAALGRHIGQALITTALGLVVAIPSMLAFSFFRNKIDSIVAECGKRVERILMPLSRQK